MVLYILIKSNIKKTKIIPLKKVEELTSLKNIVK